jgi:hypothetical protein
MTGASEDQYRATVRELQRFKAALQQRRDTRRAVESRIDVAMDEALQSEADELRRQVQEFDSERGWDSRSSTR